MDEDSSLKYYTSLLPLPDEAGLYLPPSPSSSSMSRSRSQDDSKSAKGSVELQELPDTEDTTTTEALTVPDPPPEYRVYKRRWIGVAALFCLNVAAGV